MLATLTYNVLISLLTVIDSTCSSADTIQQPILCNINLEIDGLTSAI